MKRLSTLVLASMLAVGLFGATASPVFASCSTASYTVWENPEFQGDALHVCYPIAFPDLHNVLHTAPGDCAAPIDFDPHDDWNNCINSMANYIGLGSHKVCIYTGANYTNNRGIVVGGQRVSWSSGFAFSDSISSIKWDC